MSNCYFLGAGFSNEISSNKLPLLSELGDEINSLVDEKLIQKYDYSSEKLEQFLTYLDLRTKSDPSSDEAKTRKKITTFLIERFKTNLFKNSISPVGEEFVSNVLKQDDIVITTNYDCLLEHIMCKAGIWTPNGGYSELVQNSSFNDRHPKNTSLKNIVLFKVHGSVNFLEYCALKDNGEKELSHSFISVEIEQETFPTLYANFGIIESAIKSNYIVGPSYLKVIHPQILRLWALAFKKVSDIDSLFLIGASLREKDTFLSLFLSNIQCKKVIVVNPDCENIFNRLIKISPIADASIERVALSGVKDFVYWMKIESKMK